MLLKFYFHDMAKHLRRLIAKYSSASFSSKEACGIHFTCQSLNWKRGYFKRGSSKPTGPREKLDLVSFSGVKYLFRLVVTSFGSGYMKSADVVSLIENRSTIALLDPLSDKAMHVFDLDADRRQKAVTFLQGRQWVQHKVLIQSKDVRIGRLGRFLRWLIGRDGTYLLLLGGPDQPRIQVSRAEFEDLMESLMEGSIQGSAFKDERLAIWKL
jgi:hypothetical protein